MKELGKAIQLDTLKHCMNHWRRLEDILILASNSAFLQGSCLEVMDNLSIAISSSCFNSPVVPE